MSKTVLTRQDYYPLADFHPENFKHHNIMAKYCGEKRPPKKGEWYFSGAIIEAYQAKNNLTSVYHIAQLVRVIKEVKEIITEVKNETF